MEPENARDDHQDPPQDGLKIKTIAVNQGFIPESLVFWRKWRKSAATH